MEVVSSTIVTKEKKKNVNSVLIIFYNFSTKLQALKRSYQTMSTIPEAGSEREGKKGLKYDPAFFDK